MKGFRYYHREFWMDFHFWIFGLLQLWLQRCRLRFQVVVSYLALQGFLILLQVFQPSVSTRQYPEGSYHFNCQPSIAILDCISISFYQQVSWRPNYFIGWSVDLLLGANQSAHRLCICCKGKSDSKDGLESCLDLQTSEIVSEIFLFSLKCETIIQLHD